MKPIKTSYAVKTRAQLTSELAWLRRRVAKLELLVIDLGRELFPPPEPVEYYDPLLPSADPPSSPEAQPAAQEAAWPPPQDWVEVWEGEGEGEGEDGE